jgi:hypothetical protein
MLRRFRFSVMSLALLVALASTARGQTGTISVVCVGTDTNKRLGFDIDYDRKSIVQNMAGLRLDWVTWGDEEISWRLLGPGNYAIVYRFDRRTGGLWTLYVPQNYAEYYICNKTEGKPF